MPRWGCRGRPGRSRRCEPRRSAAPVAGWPRGAPRSCSAWATPTADLMFVGEGPGRDEDLAGEPFVGRSGKLLDRLLAEELGIDRSRCYIANVVKCRPPQNRDPRPDEIEACRPYLDAQLELIAPLVVVTLGNFATRALLETTEGIRRLRGRAYPFGRRPPGPHLPPGRRPALGGRGAGRDAGRPGAGQAAPGRRGRMTGVDAAAGWSAAAATQGGRGDPGAGRGPGPAGRAGRRGAAGRAAWGPARPPSPRGSPGASGWPGR